MSSTGQHRPRRVEELTVILAMFNAGLWFIQKLYAPRLPWLASGLQYLPYMPAMALGLRPWLQHRWLNGWGNRGVVGLLLLGLLWVDHDERRTGLHFIFFTLAALPIAALIARAKLLRVATTAFALAGFCVVVTLIFAIPEWMQGAGTGMRFGQMFSPAGKQILNPNGLAFQLGFSSTFCFALGIQRSAIELSPRWRKLAFVTGGIFAALTVLPGSRGSMLALLAGLLTVFAASPGRFLAMIASLGLALSAVAALVGAGQFDVASERFADANANSAGGRTGLWAVSIDVMLSDLRQFLIGSGTGGDRRALGSMVEFGPVKGLGSDGVRRVSSHSGYFSWLLSYGLAGALIGAAAIYAAMHHIFRQPERSVRLGPFVFIAVNLLIADWHSLPAWVGAASLCCALIASRTEETTPQHLLLRSRSSDPASCGSPGRARAPAGG